MLEKLATSGLTSADAKTLKLEPHPEGHALAIQPACLAGFRIPYFNLDGTVDDEFYRFRMLQTKPSKGWASIMEEPKKPRRYSQPAGTGNHVYLPPIGDLDWEAIAADPEVSLALTEGELKAACACKYGPPTIGLGGVYNWRSAKQGHDFLPILKKFMWEGRDVTIIFDSDVKVNPMVSVAAGRLAHELVARGAIVRLGLVPAMEDGTKQGLDDLIYNTKNEDALVDIVATAEDIGPSAALHELNSLVAYIHATDEVVELATGKIITPTTFTNAAYSAYKYNEQSLRPDGTERLIPKPAARAWLDWPMRSTVTALDYAPECPTVIIPDTTAYNTWFAHGWGCEPSNKGSIKPWEELFDQVFGDLDPAHQMWAKRWFGYPIQHPGMKLRTAMLVWGHGQGTGKSRMGETMEHIYGPKNFATITKHHLESQFTGTIGNKQFIMSNELSIGGGKRELSEYLKDLITQPTVVINEKHRKEYKATDHANYYFTSNKSDALYLEADDRRFFIAQVTRPRPDPKFFLDYTQWLKKEGASRLHYYFKHELDLGDFNPYGEAPVTSDKAEMIREGYSELDAWCLDLRDNTEKVLPRERFSPEVYTVEDLVLVYSGNDPQKLRCTANAMARAIKRANITRVGGKGKGDHNIPIKSGRVRARLLAPRGDIRRFKNMAANVAGELYDAERATTRSPKFAQTAAAVVESIAKANKKKSSKPTIN